jgi:glycosyltransferase involved in cell wall biosynthesis
MKTLAVILPTYNAAPYIKTAIDSILNQSFSDFDLFVFDDCSTDNTEEIVKEYRDRRLTYQKNPVNFGLSKTLNLAILQLRYDYCYLARMDADDFAYPNRFEKQMSFLINNPQIDMCGTQGYWVENIDFTPKNAYRLPCENSQININLLFSATFGHSSVVFRSLFLLKYNLLYDESIKTCEDWDLWIRIIKYGKLANLDQFLMKYRVLENSNHRDDRTLNLHIKERCSIISKHWSSFDVLLTPEEIDYYYFLEENEEPSSFIMNLKRLIQLFNQFYFSRLNLADNEKNEIRYKLIRFIIGYRKRKKQLRFSFYQWLVLFNHVKFAKKPELTKQLIKN